MEEEGTALQSSPEPFPPQTTDPATFDLDVLMAIRTLQAVDKDAHSVADSLSSLLSSLQAALSQVTSTSVEHLSCYSEVAGHVQETALDAAAKGNRFINACLRLNEEMKGMSNMAAQLKVLRRTVDHLDNQVSRFLPRV